MRALRWYGRGDLRLDTVPTPRPAPGHALVRVERVGLCGTDLEEFRSGPHDIPVGSPHPVSGAIAPMIPGHELVGTVVRCDDRPMWIGRRVIPDVVDGCGTCWWCVRHEDGLCPDLVVRGQTTDGGLAEYMVCRSRSLVAVPGTVTTDAAAFAEPVAVATRAVAKAGDLRGATVVVLGAGVVGLLIAQVCLARGASVLGVDIAPKRRELLTRFAVPALTPDACAEAVVAATEHRGADVVFECAGHPATWAQSFSLARRGGTVLLVGISDTTPAFPWRSAVLHELRVVGTAAHVWDTDVTSAVRMIASGVVDVGPLHSLTVALSEVTDILATLSHPNDLANDLAKVLVNPWATASSTMQPHSSPRPHPLTLPKGRPDACRDLP